MIKKIFALLFMCLGVFAQSEDPVRVVLTINEDGKITSFELTKESISAWRKLYAENKISGTFTDQFISNHESNTAALIGIDRFTPESVKVEIEAARKAEQAKLLKIQSSSKVKILEKKDKN